jgi:TPP-dependent pyruvate/acetoin dehydrogenase alpha subunit
MKLLGNYWKRKYLWGIFFETINAAGVQVPLVISVWDDDYGISVHAKHQTTKENISEILKGFQRNDTAKDMKS